MESVRTWDAVLSAIGVGLKELIAGAAGAFISLRFFDELSVWEKWTTFFGGWALAAFGAQPLADVFELRPSVSIGIALLLGLFGMSLAAKLISTIRDTDWIGFTKQVIALIRGGGGDGK